MHRRWLTSGALLVLLSGPVRAEDEPKLADTTERLTADEEKAARDAVYEQGPRTAGSLPDNPFKRRLSVPRELRALYGKKPQATARFLVKVVEVGRPWDSIHAAACMGALAVSPEYGAIGIGNPDTWDEVIGGANPYTNREHSRRVCIKLIAEKERDTAPKDKKGGPGRDAEPGGSPARAARRVARRNRFRGRKTT
jgi:hypothetical protein